MPRRVRTAERLALTRRHLLAGGLTLPLLPAPALAAVAQPRFRRRRKTPALPVERRLFTSQAPPTLAQVHRFIDHLRQSLAAAKPGTVTPWRQLDLLAGLALRYGRPELLSELAGSLPPDDPRAAKWLDPGSRWHRRWAAAPSLTWSWPEAGGLTRRALPLTLRA